MSRFALLLWAWSAAALVTKDSSSRDMQEEDRGDWGLSTHYYYNNAKCIIDDLSQQKPAHTGTVANIDFEQGNFPNVKQQNNFCMRFRGQLVIKKPGKYRFQLTSDDGSVLWLARQKIVDNNGCHAAQEHRSASYNLRSGVYPLKVDMCEMSGGEVLKMTYRGPDTGGKKITVPKSALRLPGTLRIGTTG